MPKYLIVFDSGEKLTKCDDCPCFQESYRDERCGIRGDVIPNGYEEPRPDWCPLVNVASLNPALGPMGEQ